MKSKRNFEVNPRHPVILEINSRIKDGADDDSLKDMVSSLYMTAVMQAGYQLSNEDIVDFAARMGRMVTKGLDVDPNAPLADEPEVPEEEPEEEDEDEEEED